MNVSDKLRQRYLAHQRQNTELCLRAFVSDDFIFLEKIGHQLKGNAMTFGFQELSLIGAELEEASRARDPKKLKQTLDQLSRWLSQGPS